jgi:hypothetical protein
MLYLIHCRPAYWFSVDLGVLTFNPDGSEQVRLRRGNDPFPLDQQTALAARHCRLFRPRCRILGPHGPPRRSQVQATDEEHYAVGFEGAFDDVVLDTALRNRRLFARLQDEPAFRRVVKEYIRSRVYSRQRGSGHGAARQS